ncbi:uncharacterized protein TNCV_749581 [Trichonephila clavipes]|nr:uncharacterized protein TNCV_749581 [Trichonephila clavipes]
MKKEKRNTYRCGQRTVRLAGCGIQEIQSFSSGLDEKGKKEYVPLRTAYSQAGRLWHPGNPIVSRQRSLRAQAQQIQTETKTLRLLKSKEKKTEHFVMASDPIFTHLIQELYSDSYVAVLGSISDIIKDCKPKGPLTKSLLELLPKVFDVLEIGIKDCWPIYIDKNLKSIVASPELYVSHVMMMCWIEKNTTPDIYERFLIVLTLVKYVVDLVYHTSGGGWKHLKKHILNKKYLEYYDECLSYDFVFDDIPKDLKQRMQDSYSPLQTLDSIFIRKNTSNFKKKLISPTLNKEHSVSKEVGRSSSTEANGLEDLEMMPSLEIKYRHCVGQIKQLEEKLIQLISTFQLLEGRVS